MMEAERARERGQPESESKSKSESASASASALLVPPLRSDTASKLPSYRVADLTGGRTTATVMGLINPQYDISPPPPATGQVPGQEHEHEHPHQHHQVSSSSSTPQQNKQQHQQTPNPPNPAPESTTITAAAATVLSEGRTVSLGAIVDKRNIREFVVERKRHRRHRSANNVVTPDTTTTTTKNRNSNSSSPSRPKTSSASDFTTAPTTVASAPSPSHKTRISPVLLQQQQSQDPPRTKPLPPPPPLSSRKSRTSKVPASNSRRDVEWEGPPPAMITQRSFPFETSTTSSSPTTTTTTTTNTTQNWVETQSPVIDQTISPTTSHSSRSPSEGTPVRPRIQPIRGFKPSSRRSTDMASKRNSMIDPDSTLRAMDGFEALRSGQHHPEHEEQNSDESDLFLRAAKEEELAQRNHINERLIRSDRRRSQIGQRFSVPPTSINLQPTTSRRRGSDHESPMNYRTKDDQEGAGQPTTHRPSPRERPSALDDINKSRYYGSNSRSNPTTPRTISSNRELSPESQVSYGGRRPSIPENNMSRGTSYRQSNLSYSTPRTYNSSPPVARTAEVQVQEGDSETPRATEGTDSTVSTTAPSTMWDELDELKSRIHRLELTGKLPPTSGAAMSRVSHDRPPTATTTVTTISSSPKRGRNNSISASDANLPEVPEHHPLLHAALVKSKPLLHPDIFKALEAATSDALAISQMMGVPGQPGPLSSQSTVGGLSGVSDRQVRRKADSMCRSLTELCLALSDGKMDHQPQVQIASSVAATAGRETEVQQSIESVPNNERLGMSNDLLRAKSSPRSFSRLEARRSSMLTASALPAPRFNLNESSTPSQSAMSNRRTSMLLRSTRRGTEEPEEEDEMRFRAPSRATTEIGRIRNSPREFINQPKFSERLNDRYAERQPERGAVQSNLPIRRTYTSTGVINNTPPSMPPVSNLGGRRFLERATPERDTISNAGVNSTTSRLADERAQRKASLSTPSALPTRTGSLTRKTRQGNSHSADLTAGQHGGYHQ